MLPADHCHLTDGQVYHYWFEVTDTHPTALGPAPQSDRSHGIYRRLAPARPAAGWAEYGDDERYPAAVVRYSDGRSSPCDAGGETGALDTNHPSTALPPNPRLVLYELPTAWTRTGSAGEREIGIGTFRDVLALISPQTGGANFADLEVTQPGRSYLTELGVNALELLPPADSFYSRQWGYGTTNFCAPDFELGFPGDYAWPTPNRDLRALIAACHARRLRFFVDVVMAFARTHAYLAAATNDFFILDPRSNPSDPDAHNSRGKDDNNFRDGFGSTLLRYAAFVDGYDPISGRQTRLSPARQLMKTSLLRWMHDFHIDGIRMDSVENVSNWDFIQEYKDLARDTWRERFAAQGAGNGAEARFLVVGEELREPLDLLRQQRLDGLWHEHFKRYIRAALLGQNAGASRASNGPCARPSIAGSLATATPRRRSFISPPTTSRAFVTSAC